MDIVDPRELTFGRKGWFARKAASMLMRVLKLSRINEINALAESAGPGGDIEVMLSEMGLEYTICDKDIANVPTTGPLIIISNHPTGAPDGIVLIDALRRIRPDVKFMGNFLLNRIAFLRSYFIAVDPFDTSAKGRNISGIRASKEHLAKGGALVIFPAGEVATWQKGFSKVRDKRWSASVMKFIRSAEVPVVPLFIEARNSLGFRLAGKIHPKLRTALLPRQALNKRGKPMIISIGSAITPRRMVEISSLQTYSDFLRANVEYLTSKKARRKLKIIPKRAPKEVEPADIISPVETGELLHELARIRGEHLLFEHGNFDAYFAAPEDIPHMMKEIGRMREVTFREIGEGSMKSIDTDHYDTYYRQLFLWDRVERTLVGAYRMGMGDEIMEKYGLEGFYTYSLFRMSKEMAPIMANTIELGRSFITAEYQRKTVSLMLLWKGILYVLMKHTQFRNLLGPVTISGDFEANSKMVIVDFLRRNHLNATLARYIRPVTGMAGIRTSVDLSLIRDIDSIELINKLVCDIERDEFSVPVLIKKYLQLNSYVLAFNVDHDFRDALDALMLVDLKHFPESTIMMLSREITDIDVVGRFKEYQ